MTYKRKEQIGDCTLYLGDCLEILPTLGKVDAVVTDPPYPDYFADEYQYDAGALSALCINRGMVFWTSKQAFPLAHTAIHIWDKKTGCGSEYERIFEIGGQRNYKVFRHYFINSTLAASLQKDVFTGHPSQKPIRLIKDVVKHITAHDEVVADYFMGSGTTGVACVQLGRKFIGIEIDEGYFDIACERISRAERQPDMFVQKFEQEALI